MKKIVIFIEKYSFLLGIALFVIIISTTNIVEIFRHIKNINPFYLLLAALITFPMFLSKSLCWNYIIRKQGIKYDFKNSLLMYWAGVYIGFLTPGKIGEISKALYLKKDGHSMGESIIGVILDRISDFIFLLTFALIGSLFLLGFIQKQVIILLLGILIFFVIFIIFWRIGLIKMIFKKMLSVLLPPKYQKSWNINIQDFISGLKIFKLKNYLIIFIITAFSWLFYYLQMYVLTRGIGMDISFLYLAVFVTITGFITLIPVSISGIGTRDASLILLLSPLLIPKEQIIVFSALMLAMLLFAGLIGLICWLIKPLRIK